MVNWGAVQNEFIDVDNNEVEKVVIKYKNGKEKIVEKALVLSLKNDDVISDTVGLTSEQYIQMVLTMYELAKIMGLTEEGE